MKKIILAVVVMLFLIAPAHALFEDKVFYPEESKVVIRDWANQPIVDVILIDNTYECLIDCEATFKIVAHQNEPLSNEDKNKLEFYDDLNRVSKDILDYQFYLQQTKIVTINNSYSYIEEYGDVIIEANGTKHKNTRNVLVEKYDNIELPYLKAINLNDLDLKKGTEYNIILRGTKVPNTAVDWQPTLFSIKVDEFAWWNSSWAYKKQITVGNPAAATLVGSVNGSGENWHGVNITVDTATLVTAGKLRADGSDLRITYNGTGTPVELDRVNITAWNSAETRIYFPLATNMTTGTLDGNYEMYYSNALGINPPENKSDIFWRWYGFEQNNIAGWTVGAGGFTAETYNPRERAYRGNFTTAQDIITFDEFFPDTNMRLSTDYIVHDDLSSTFFITTTAKTEASGVWCPVIRDITAGCNGYNFCWFGPNTDMNFGQGAGGDSPELWMRWTIRYDDDTNAIFTDDRGNTSISANPWHNDVPRGIFIEQEAGGGALDDMQFSQDYAAAGTPSNVTFGSEISSNNAPTVNSITPATGFQTYDSTPEHTFNFTDPEENTADCFLMYENIPYARNTTTVDSFTTSLTPNATIAEGIYNWWMSCDDGAGGTGTSANRSIIINTSTFSVTLVAPATATETTNTSVQFNCTANDDSNFIDNTTLQVWYDDGTPYTSVTNTSGTNNYFEYITQVDTIPNENYTWNCEAYNNLSNSTWAGVNFTFTVDNVVPDVVITGPTNTSYSTSPVSLNTTITDLTAGVSACWYSNDSWALNTTYNCTTSNLVFSDGAFNLLVGANDTLDNINMTESISFTLDTTAPTVTINTPTNSTFNNASQILNTTIADNIALSACWYSNDSFVTNYSFTCNTIVQIDSLPQGATLLFVAANDSSDNQNRTNVSFTIDSIAPVVAIYAPTNLSLFDYASGNVTFNFSATDASTPISLCWYEDLNGVNVTLPSCNNITITPALYSFVKLRVWANDTASNLASAETYYGTYNVSSYTYIADVVTGSANTMTLDLLLGNSIFANANSAFLYYNNTYVGAGTSTLNNATRKVWTYAHTSPFVTATQAFNLRWRLNNTVATSVTTADLFNRSQTVWLPTIFAGVTNGTVIVNVTTYAETGRDRVVMALDNVFTLWTSNRNNNWNFTFSQTGASEYLFSLFPNWTTNIYTETLFSYKSVDSVQETHYLINSTLSNSTVTSVFLYGLNDTLDSVFDVYVEDSDYQAKSGVFVQAQRYYPSLNIFDTVETGKTDIDGKTVVHLVEDSVDYRYSVIDSNGVLLYTTTASRATCAPSTQCTLTIHIPLASTGAITGLLTDISSVFYNISFNSDTKVVTYDFYKTNGAASNFRLEVASYDWNKNSIPCNTSTTSTGGSLTCNLTTAANGTYSVNAYVNVETRHSIGMLVTLFNEAADIFGDEGLLWGILLIIVMATIGVAFGIHGVLILGVAGTFIVSVIGLINIPLGIIISLAILAGIILYKSREGEGN